MEHYVGLDVSLKLTAICIVDRTGKIERDVGGTQPPTQSFSNLTLVAIALGGIDMAIANTKRGLDRFDADRIHQRHGSEADGGEKESVIPCDCMTGRLWG